MDISERQRFLIETLAAKERAEATVQGLMQAKAECEKHLEQANRKDMLKTVTGRSALDNAITHAQRMVASLDRAIDQVRKELGQHSGDLLAEGLAPIIRARAAAEVGGFGGAAGAD
jgi:hypothetical protein